MKIYETCDGEAFAEDYVMTIDGIEVPLHQARVSSVPFNRRWPGHQRTQEQTEVTYFALFSIDSPVRIEITPNFAFENAEIHPFSSHIKPEINHGKITFVMDKPAYLTVEIDGVHKVLHIFGDKPCEYVLQKEKNEVIYYGKGLHDAGIIELHSNQTLFLDEGAVVFGEVYAKDAENIRIVGNGILDNSKNKAKILYEISVDNNMEAVNNAERTNTIQLEYCKNIEISGITIRDSLLYSVRPICCENLRINQLKIIGNWRYNSDGIDMHNCRDVVISDCFIRTFDDSICIKGFDYLLDEKDMQHGGKLYDIFENVHVKNCVIWNDWGIALEIGAETRAKEIRNILFENCDIIHTTACSLDVGNVDYADVHDIEFRNIRVEHRDVVQRPQIQRNDSEVYVEDRESEFLSVLMSTSIHYIKEYCLPDGIRGKNSNIKFKDIYVTAKEMPPSRFKGYDEEHQVKGITIENLYFNGRKINSLADGKVNMGEFVCDVALI